jgi:hypothetical protein
MRRVRRFRHLPGWLRPLPDRKCCGCGAGAEKQKRERERVTKSERAEEDEACHSADEPTAEDERPRLSSRQIAIP